MPAYWMLSRMGNRVLRPGGRRLTHTMLDALGITPGDVVVELAPGLGMTTRLILAAGPVSTPGSSVINVPLTSSGLCFPHYNTPARSGLHKKPGWPMPPRPWCSGRPS